MKRDIICTLGTTTDNAQVLEKMVENGMNGVRLNTAYASIQDYEKRVGMAKDAKSDIKIMLDIKGPQVRLGDFEMFTISDGQEFLAGFPDRKGNTKNIVYFNKDFYNDVSVGDFILIENGTIATEVVKKYNYDHDIRLKVLNSGEGVIHKQMGVNVPGVYLNVEQLSEKDKEVIQWGVEYGAEQIALSFVRDVDDVKNCYEYIKSIDDKPTIELNLKIEDRLGVNNLEEILNYVKKNSIKTSVMVARGDLFVELGISELALAQDYIVRTCKGYGIPVIVGTGILSSMQNNRYPTRSEVGDVQHILSIGADGFMLSGETSYGKNPALVVETLTKIINKYDAGPMYGSQSKSDFLENNHAENSHIAETADNYRMRNNRINITPAGSKESNRKDESENQEIIEL